VQDTGRQLDVRDRGARRPARGEGPAQAAELAEASELAAPAARAEAEMTPIQASSA
jgi:hypothetical protein